MVYNDSKIIIIYITRLEMMTNHREESRQHEIMSEKQIQEDEKARNHRFRLDQTGEVREKR